MCRSLIIYRKVVFIDNGTYCICIYACSSSVISSFIEKYQLTDDDIELDFHKPVKIKIEVGKCRCCGKGKKQYKYLDVERINPWSNHAETINGGWINSCDYELVKK